MSLTQSTSPIFEVGGDAAAEIVGSSLLLSDGELQELLASLLPHLDLDALDDVPVEASLTPPEYPVDAMPPVTIAGNESGDGIGSLEPREPGSSPVQPRLSSPTDKERSWVAQKAYHLGPFCGSERFCEIVQQHLPCFPRETTLEAFERCNLAVGRQTARLEPYVPLPPEINSDEE